MSEERQDTWGRRFAAEVDRMLRRTIVQPAFLTHLVPVLDRVRELPIAQPERYQREEVRLAGVEIPPDVRDRLHDTLGIGVEKARIHEDDAAHELATQHRADALTIGSDIYFKRGAYQPRDPKGLALLGHEVAHVVRGLEPDHRWQRATDAGVAREERYASSVERHLADRRSGSAPLRAEASKPIAPAPVAPPAPERPMAALSERAEAIAPPTAPVDLGALKQTILRELRDELRTEAQRGA